MLGYEQRRYYIHHFCDTLRTKALAHALKENVNLKMLELGRNHIHPDGAKALAQAIRINHVLRELDIEHNV